MDTLALSPLSTGINLASLGAGKGSSTSEVSSEPMLGGLQAGEVWLVDVKSPILDVGLWPFLSSGPAPSSCRLSPVVTDAVDVGLFSGLLRLVLESS